jgi:hypothetical protein
LRTRTNQTETVFKQLKPFKTVYKWCFGGQVLWTYLEDQIELSDHNKVTDKTLSPLPVHKEVHQGAYEAEWWREADAMCSPRWSTGIKYKDPARK